MPGATEQHVLSALDAIRAENKRGAVHRDFMQARLDDIAERKKKLEQEMVQCDEEEKEVYRHSHEVGDKFLSRRNELSRAAIQLLKIESGEISDRSLLWTFIAERQLAHYKDDSTKESYVAKLTRIDYVIRQASDLGISLPVLTIHHDSLYTGNAFDANLVHTDPITTGLVVSDTSGDYPDDYPHIKLTGSVLGKRTISGNSNGRIPIYDENYSRSYILTPSEVKLWSRPEQKPPGRTSHIDFLIGEENVLKYLYLLKAQEDDSSQAELWEIGTIIHGDSHLFQAARTNKAICEFWSNSAVIKLTKMFGDPFRQRPDEMSIYLDMLDSAGRQAFTQALCANYGLTEEYAKIYIDTLCNTELVKQPALNSAK